MVVEHLNKEDWVEGVWVVYEAVNAEVVQVVEALEAVKVGVVQVVEALEAVMEEVD